MEEAKQMISINGANIPVTFPAGLDENTATTAVDDAAVRYTKDATTGIWTLDSKPTEGGRGRRKSGKAKGGRKGTKKSRRKSAKVKGGKRRSAKKGK